MAGSPLSACAECILEVGGSIEELFTGEKTIIEVLSQDNLLTRLFATANVTKKTAFLRSLAHARPSLRILEIGGSTGQSTSSLIRDLTLPHGVFLYQSFTFTDPSSTAIADAKKQFQGLDHIEFRVLDIATDPADQGFKEDEKFDLAVATNYVHATSSLSGSLTNIRKLLAPVGRLLLQEISMETK